MPAHTLTIEFSFGHFVEGLSVDTMLADYNMLNGRRFILVLLSAFIAPVVCGWALARTNVSGNARTGRANL